MQELVDKIQEVTRDGSPSVGQWIELGDLAKKYGVKKFEMEKMVDEALKQETPSVSEKGIDVESSDNTEIVENLVVKEEKPDYTYEYKRDLSFERPNFEFNRDKFEQEMNNRREQEDKMFEREDTPEIEQPEVVFPELNVEFDQPVEPIEFKEEKIEPINQEPIAPIQNNIDPPKQEEIDAPEIPEMEFTIESNDPEMEYEDISTTKFEEDPTEFETTVEFENIADYIAESNKRAMEEAKRREEKEKKRERNEFKQSKPKQQRQQNSRQNQQQRKRDSSMVTHAEAKKARTVGIVAAVVGLLFGFVGIFIGLYGLSLNNRLKNEIDESANLYGDQIKQNVSVGRGLSIAGIVIGSLRLFNSLSDIFL